MEEEGKAIAEELGVTYNSPRYSKGQFQFHVFTDPLTGGTFAATNRIKAWARFFELREQFNAPIPDRFPQQYRDILIRYRGNIEKELRERGLKSNVEELAPMTESEPEKEMSYDLRPMSPESGPPVPRMFGVKWPWIRGGD